MRDDDDETWLLYRTKFCPCCRAVVRHRPIPIFLVKSIAASLTKASKRPSSLIEVVEEEDVWAGLFMTASEEELDDDEDDDQEFDEDDSSDPDGFENENDPYDSDAPPEEDEDDEIFSYETDEDAPPYEGHYMPAHWESPRIPVDSDDESHHGVNPITMALIRRGCTQEMIYEYDMIYTDEGGIVAYLDAGYIVYLGWNILVSITQKVT